jgi:hypothetical protein
MIADMWNGNDVRPNTALFHRMCLTLLAERKDLPATETLKSVYPVLVDLHRERLV